MAFLKQFIVSGTWTTGLSDYELVSYNLRKSLGVIYQKGFPNFPDETFRALK